jgi:hypothetical protein
MKVYVLPADDAHGLLVGYIAMHVNLPHPSGSEVQYDHRLCRRTPYTGLPLEETWQRVRQCSTWELSDLPTSTYSWSWARRASGPHQQRSIRQPNLQPADIKQESERSQQGSRSTPTRYQFTTQGSLLEEEPELLGCLHSCERKDPIPRQLQLRGAGGTSLQRSCTRSLGPVGQTKRCLKGVRAVAGDAQ